MFPHGGVWGNVASWRSLGARCLLGVSWNMVRPCHMQKEAQWALGRLGGRLWPQRELRITSPPPSLPKPRTCKAGGSACCMPRALGLEHVACHEPSTSSSLWSLDLKHVLNRCPDLKHPLPPPPLA
eukprot:364280-Chlamydomonas_euryale.AAC.20